MDATFSSDNELNANEDAICRMSRMTWGSIELQGEDAQLLAKVLLRRRLVGLRARMGEVRKLFGNVWSKTRTQQSDQVQECEASLEASMDKLVILVGQLR